jgi:hypothetical protein
MRENTIAAGCQQNDEPSLHGYFSSTLLRNERISARGSSCHLNSFNGLRPLAPLHPIRFRPNQSHISQLAQSPLESLLALLDYFTFSSVKAGIIAVVGLALGFLLRRKIAEGATIITALFQSASSSIRSLCFWGTCSASRIM